MQCEKDALLSYFRRKLRHCGWSDEPLARRLLISPVFGYSLDCPVTSNQLRSPAGLLLVLIQCSLVLKQKLNSTSQKERNPRKSL
jgi:hypothetical protein